MRITIPDSVLSERYRSGDSAGVLARDCGVTDTAIYQRLNKLHVPRRSASECHLGVPTKSAHHFWKGGKIKKRNGYIGVYMPEHHRAHSNHYVLEHVLVAERALGKPLDSKHPVHHFNEIKTDNSNSNLVICEDDAYHQLLHLRKRVLDAGGDPDLDKWCRGCNRALPKSSGFYSNADAHDGLRVRCKDCTKISVKQRKNRTCQ